MEQIIIPPDEPVNTISLDSITYQHNYIYAFFCRGYVYKLIEDTKLSNFVFLMQASSGFQFCYSARTINSCIELALKNRQKVYRFQEAKEYFRWGAEQFRQK